MKFVHCYKLYTFGLQPEELPNGSSFKKLLFFTAFGTNVVNGEIVPRDRHAKGAGQFSCETGQANVGELSAAVTEQMVVLVRGFFKAVSTAVHMHAADHSCIVHGIEIVVDGGHGNAGHTELGKKEDLVGRQMTVCLI